MMARRTDGSEPSVNVRGARIQLAISFGAFVGILGCAFYLGQIWAHFQRYIAQQEGIVAQQAEIAASLHNVDKRLVKIETRLDAGGPRRPAETTR